MHAEGHWSVGHRKVFAFVNKAVVKNCMQGFLWMLVFISLR